MQILVELIERVLVRSINLLSSKFHYKHYVSTFTLTNFVLLFYSSTWTMYLKLTYILINNTYVMSIEPCSLQLNPNQLVVMNIDMVTIVVYVFSQT